MKLAVCLYMLCFAFRRAVQLSFRIEEHEGNILFVIFHYAAMGGLVGFYAVCHCFSAAFICLFYVNVIYLYITC